MPSPPARGEQHPEQVAFTTSLGLEDQADRPDFASRLASEACDLGHGAALPETYDLIDRTRSKYRNLDLVSYFPDTMSRNICERTRDVVHLQEHRIAEGVLPIRKIDPLMRALEGAAVVTGLRAAQRQPRLLPRLERDNMTGLIKFNPIVDWTDAELETYIHPVASPQIRCTGKVFRPLAARRAPERCSKASIHAPAAGGGSSLPKNAVCTRADRRVLMNER